MGIRDAVTFVDEFGRGLDGLFGTEASVEKFLRTYTIESVTPGAGAAPFAGLPIVRSRLVPENQILLFDRGRLVQRIFLSPEAQRAHEQAQPRPPEPR